MKRNEVTVIQYHNGTRIVRGDYAVSGESGVPTGVRVHSNIAQAYAHERGNVRTLIARMMQDVPLRDWK